MIKLFKNKMLIALFLLVIGISVTSSCYAINIVKNSDGLALNGFNRDAVQDFLIKNGYSDYATGKYFLVRDFNSETSSYHAFVFDSSQISYLGENSSTELCINFFNNNNERIKANYVWLEFDCVANSFVFKSVSEDVYNFYLFKTSQEIIYSDFDIINPVDGSVLWSLSNVNINTNFNYKFVAESKNKLALTITDLDSSYKMIGFVDNPTTYEVGDVLSAGIDIAYQRITPRRFR